MLTAFIGVLAALLYLVARPFVAPLGAAVVPAMAALYGVLGGAMMVHRDGVDFNVLEPAALAIGLFVAICAGFGAAVSSLTNAAVADNGWADAPELVAPRPAAARDVDPAVRRRRVLRRHVQLAREHSAAAPSGCGGWSTGARSP